MSTSRAKPYTARRCGRRRRGKRSEATGKFSVRALRATEVTSIPTQSRLRRRPVNHGCAKSAAGGSIAARRSARTPPRGARDRREETLPEQQDGGSLRK